MSVFQPVTLNWEGRDYTIPPNRIMGAIATIESVMTLGELAQASQTSNIPITKLAQAYSNLLVYAGANTADWESVYVSMFAGNQTVALLAVRSLLVLMMPPKSMVEVMSSPEGKKKPGKSKAGSSKSPTRQQSASNG